MAVKLNQHDLEFILKQIKIAEAHVAGTPLDQLLAQPHLPYGLRTVDGSYNNITPGRELWGAADQIMPRAMQPHYLNEGDDTYSGIPMNNDYGVVGTETQDPDGDGPERAPNAGHTGNVVDADPRIISNLISDQTLNNPAAITAALQYAGSENLSEDLAAVRAAYADYVQTIADNDLADPDNAAGLAAAKADLDAHLLEEYGIQMDGNSILLPNVSPDEGLSAPFNGWMTFFGQFFDHGLDLIHKGDNGTIYMPLAADDPLVTHGPDGIAGSGDEVSPHLPLVLTRLTPTMGPGPDGVLGTGDDTTEARNKTTPFVDQNQTYTSHPSHQVFLREYEMVDGKPLATGRLLNGENGGLATWKDVKDQAREKLGIDLDDRDVFGVPLILTDPYGEFIRDENGFPQVVVNIGPDLIPNTADDVTVSGTAESPISLAGLNGGRGPVRTSHAFLDDIAHNAVPILVPGAEGQPAILMPDPNSGTDPLGDPIPVDPETQLPVYDNELLDKHFITGDGRGNENIGLTAVHHVFHSEHNRQVEANKKIILEIAEAGDIAFLNEWLLEPVEAGFDPGALRWDGERLFQTARFATEMQYQHLVFEEFGRKVSPLIDVFVFNTVTDVNPAIFAEFAHTVYRFGHSMLTDHLKLLPLDEEGNPVDAQGNAVAVADWGVDVGLIEAFLNPILYNQDGGITSEQAAGAIFRGMTYVHGNEIDEFVVDSLRNNLLGLPLDLPAINIARGRDAGVPSLNEAREQLYAASNSSWLKPYDSWADFGANLKTPASVINFIAAYGTHPLILEADTLAEKREAAMQLLGLAEPPESAAVAVEIENGSFEAESLATGEPGVISDALGNYTTEGPSGWTLTGDGGLIVPAESVVNGAGIEGTNVAWLREGGMLSQDTGLVLEEGASYRLTLDVGDRTNMDWPGGQARLVSASGVVLAVVDLEAPADGEWETVTIDSGPIEAEHAGLGLSIEIQQGDGTANQILIDNVRLEREPAPGIPDRLDFLNGTGAWASEETGLNLVDLWIGGLAEQIMPFGGMLGSTFNAIFELQLENLQEGDRFYYLSRTQGLNLLNELENNAFSKLVMANTDMALPGADGILGTEDDEVNFHVGVDSFAKHDIVLEVDQSKQIPLDPEGDDPFLAAVRAKVQRDDPSTPGADENYLRFTGGEHVVMGGTENDDTIIGGEGDDAIWGDAGNDRIEGGHGVDLIIGGAGDDIITDTGDTGDFIKGEGGDDVIANSNGLDVIMGGDGADVMLVGVDATEVFAGEGNDFILGGLDHDFILGNEGDDWMEGGDGFDVLNGDNSELFFNSTILGHDVAFAGANENDFDMESGDDIMVQGESVMRNEGMFGFDWAIHKGSAVAADSDMRIPIFTTVYDDILRDRFDQTEALSGWIHNDVLRGDDRGSTEEIEVELSLENHGLTQAGVDRIDGLRELLGISIEDAPTDPDVDLESIVAWAEGNILLGGDGSDTFEGRGANDFIHGDAWLNVRLSIRELDGDTVTDTEAFTVDSLKDMVSIDGETKSLSAFLLSGQIKPKQLQIIREIKYDEDSTNDTDTAIFAGNRDWYEITTVGDRTYVTRREHEDIDPQVDEGSDTLIGIERIQFADGLYTIRQTGNYDPTGRLVISGLPATEGMPLTVSADNIRDLNNPDGKVHPLDITYRWQIERNDGTGDYIDIPGSSGNTFTPLDEHAGLRVRVIGTYFDAAGVMEIVSSHPTDVVLGTNDDPSGPLLLSDMTPTEGQPLTATVAFNDPDGMSDAFEEFLLTYQWQYEVDGVWTDVPAEDGGNERTFTPGPAQVGHPIRMVVDYQDDLLNSHQVISEVTQIVGNYIVSNAATINATNGDAEGGTSVGDDWVEGGNSPNSISAGDGNDVINGGGGTDTLNGGAGDDVLNGGEGSDTVNGNGGNDTILYSVNGDADVIDGGTGNDRVRVIQESEIDNDNVAVDMANGQISRIISATLDSIESVELDTGGGVDTLTYSTTDNVSVNLLTGAATGFTFTRGVENVTSGSGDDSLRGNSLENLLKGRGGNDSLRGGFGNDVLEGGDGNDQLWGDQGDDVLEGGEGDDRIDGGLGVDTASFASALSGVTVSIAGATSFEAQDTGAGNDEVINIENLTGSAFADSLEGDGKANIIDGGAGADLMTGGAGDDTYVVSDAGDSTVEALDGGTDTVHSGLEGYELEDNVENLVLLDGVIEGRGNELDNRLTGNAQDNILRGGLGVNTVVLSGAIFEQAFALSNIQGSGAIDLDGTDQLTVDSAAGGTDILVDIQRVDLEGVVYDIVAGSNAADPTLTGSSSDELLLGLAGQDVLNGGEGNDILIGGAGADTMLGGAGDDVYVVEQGSDYVEEAAGGGMDTILSSITTNLDNAARVSGEFENVTLFGTQDIDAHGNEFANTLTGNSGSNTLTGRGGSDRLIGNAGDDTLNGGAASDTLIGGEGDDILNGQGGLADVAVFSGPAGNYSFDVTDGSLASVTDMVGTDGSDTLANIERIQFGGGEILTILTNGGTATAPSLIFGTEDGETITGSTGDDVIIGGAGDDTLNGYDVGDGDDDTVTPQLDDDTFIWNAANGGDGMDTINGGGEGIEGDTFQIVGNEEAETYRIYTYEEAVARIGYAGSDEVEIIVTREVGGVGEAAATVIAELTEIEEIVLNGAGLSGIGGETAGDTFEMYGTFDVTTSLRPDTITIFGSSGDDTIDISSLTSAHRIVFRTKGGNDTIIGTVRPQDVIELADGSTIDDYVIVQNPDGSTRISSDTHSVTFVSKGILPQFAAPSDDDDDDVGGPVVDPNDGDGNEDAGDDDVVTPPVDQNGDDDGNEDDEDDDVATPPVDQNADDDDEDDEDDDATSPPVDQDDDDNDDEDGDEDHDQPCSEDDDEYEDDDEVAPLPASTIVGTEDADSLIGTAKGEAIMASGGQDVVFGHGGNDDIFGGKANDMLYGDGGNDRILGENGDDFINGGAGKDTVFGGNGDDLIVAEAGDGDDTYYGDDMVGGSGIDTLDMSAIMAAISANLGTGFKGRGSVSSTETGNDGLWGVENIVLGSGDDTVTASAEVNVIDGGAGDDTFRFLSAADADGDTLMSFEPGDRIDLSELDANGCASGNQSFSLVSEAFTGRGQLMIDHQTIDGEDYTVVKGNTSGDDDAEFTINIKGRHELGVSDFSL